MTTENPKIDIEHPDATISELWLQHGVIIGLLVIGPLTTIDPRLPAGVGWIGLLLGIPPIAFAIWHARRTALRLNHKVRWNSERIDRVVDDQVVWGVPWGEAHLEILPHWWRGTEVTIKSPAGEVIATTGFLSAHYDMAGWIQRQYLAEFIVRAKSFEALPREWDLSLKRAFFSLLETIGYGAWINYLIQPGDPGALSHAVVFGGVMACAHAAIVITSVSISLLSRFGVRETRESTLEFSRKPVLTRVPMNPGTRYQYTEAIRKQSSQGGRTDLRIGLFLLLAFCLLFGITLQWAPWVLVITAVLGTAFILAFMHPAFWVMPHRLDQFKLEQDELVVWQGKREMRFPAAPKKTWDHGPRSSQWGFGCDVFGHGINSYWIDICYIEEVPASTSESGAFGAGRTTM